VQDSDGFGTRQKRYRCDKHTNYLLKGRLVPTTSPAARPTRPCGMCSRRGCISIVLRRAAKSTIYHRSPERSARFFLSRAASANFLRSAARSPLSIAFFSLTPSLVDVSAKVNSMPNRRHRDAMSRYRSAMIWCRTRRAAQEASQPAKMAWSLLRFIDSLEKRSG
jgi:hypothetical protein